MMYELDIQILIALIFFISGLVHGVVGFAFALLSTPLISILIPVQEAILITLVPTIWANIFSILQVKIKLNILKSYIPMFFSIILGSILGTYLLFIISPWIFNIFLITLMWSYLYIDYKKSLIHFDNLNNKKYKYIIGIFLGICAGISNIMSPILLIYFLSTKKKSIEIIIVSNISFLLAKAVQLSIFSQYDKFSSDYVLFTVIILILISISLRLGEKIRKLDLILSNYVKIVKISIFIISLVLLTKTIL